MPRKKSVNSDNKQNVQESAVVGQQEEATANSVLSALNDMVDHEVEPDQEVDASGQDNGDQPEDDAKQLQSALEEENRNLRDQLLRVAAEFENCKKRMSRDRATDLKYAQENFLKELLPTIDNLERALNQKESANNIETMFEGVELTLKGLLTTVNKLGLESLESVGKPFDPNFHEALVMEASEEVPEQHVIREFEKGYRYKERLLRAAKVVVSKGKES